MAADGGSAFPRPASTSNHGFPYAEQDGMSLRDWFAGQVIVGMAAADPEGPSMRPQDAAQIMAQGAYQLADAMLEARNSEEPA